MSICPADHKPCIDDLCYGSGCLKLGGYEPMLEKCPGCGQLVAINGSNSEDCECEPVDGDDDDDDPCPDGEHRWVGRQQGGSPDAVESYEWVVYCDIFGMEKPPED